MIRGRAIRAEDKQQRYHAILDAAERLLMRSAEHGVNMAEVADKAGLAKGTVYLYFPSKEELFLALHERNIEAFFRALIGLLETSRPATIDNVWPLIQRYMVDSPLFLPLASRCFGMTDQKLAVDAVMGFKIRMAMHLERAAAGLERHFPDLPRSDGVMLLRHSFALILGFWRLAESTSAPCAPHPMDGVTDAHPKVYAWSYACELERALRALWEGTIRFDGQRTAR